MDEFLVVVWVDGLRGVRGAAYVDGSLLDVECPPKPDNLSVGIDAVLASEASVRVIFAGLNDDIRGSFQVLGNLVDDKVEWLRIMNRVVGGKTGVCSETRFGLLVGIVLGGRGYFLGLDLGRKRVIRQSKSARDGG